MDTTVAPHSTTEFLSFTLGGLEYGLEFSKVRELRVLRSLERIAAGGTLDGIAAPRGAIVPIVDMRAAVEGSPAPPDPATDVVILQLDSCVMGLVVDRITGVVELRRDQIGPMPGANRESGHLIGLGESDGRRLVLVDIDKLMAIRKARASMGSVAAFGGD